MSNSQSGQSVQPQELLLSMATVPLLAGLVVARAAAELAITLGQASEEVFRGDRLPTLHQPSQSPPVAEADQGN